MSRRPPNPAAERAAQNQQTIKSLLKLEANKICADCKRNKHPRWASWNLGVFICIRCSGIHRGMGTHISRVKSVDLDSWTDEQLQSILSWGNARANKYWEDKLAPGHVPSESKIENFIRTKYELKRWVMDGGIPDPATLDVEGDDDIPLSIVKEKQTLDRKESIRKASVGKSAAPPAAAIGLRTAAAPTADLIGGDPIPQRASTAGPTLSKVPPKAEPAPPKTTSTLLGLDFLGSEPAAPPRPSSTTGTGGVGGQSRPDLKQSILSLYATTPRPQQQQPSHSHSGSFSGMPPSSPPLPQQPPQGGGMGSMNDAFSSLSFSTSTSTATAPKPSSTHDAFAGLGSISKSRSPPPAQTQTASSAFGGLSGGGFFDTKPTPAAAPPPHQQQKSSFGGSSSGFGFGASSSPPVASKPAPAPVPASSALGDLFDFSSPAPAAAPPQPAPAPAFPAASAAPSSTTSVFNLSASTQAKSPPPAAAPAATSTTTTALPSLGSSANWSNADVWGNAWGSSDSPAAGTAPAKSPEAAKTSSASGFGGWGSSAGAGLGAGLGGGLGAGLGGGLGGGGLASQSIVPGMSGGFAPKVAADEEFGGWASSTGPTTNTTTTGAGTGGNAKPAGGFGGNDDLFSNVWQ